MRIGVPKEIKTQEFRVGMTPAGVAILVARGHTVLIEQSAGVGSSIPDEAYVKAGAKIVATRDEVWGGSDMIVKVKEPIAPEFALMRKDLLLFTYLHLAAAHELGKELLTRGVNGVAYETIEPTPGDLPLLTPMSAVAGRMSVQAGATYLERERGGKGVLLGGVPGVKRGRVVIIGGGVVGQNACKIAVGLGANVTVLETNLKTLAYIDDVYVGRAVSTQFSDPLSIEKAVLESDLVIGAVLIAGLGDRRRIDRSGRLRRDRAPDHARQPDVPRPRRHPLRRREHAGRGAADVDVRAHQRDDPIRRNARRSRPRARGCHHTPPGNRDQHVQGHGAAPSGCRSARRAAHAIPRVTVTAWFRHLGV
jgi:hypothetical protein